MGAPMGNNNAAGPHKGWGKRGSSKYYSSLHRKISIQGGFAETFAGSKAPSYVRGRMKTWERSNRVPRPTKMHMKFT